MQTHAVEAASCNPFQLWWLSSLDVGVRRGVISATFKVLELEDS